ncbi:MAG: histidine kinase N-terminal 7TM domain-containing protein [Candidatus Methanomethylophilaceae archaeon]
MELSPEMVVSIFPNLVSIFIMAYLTYKVTTTPMEYKRPMFGMFLSLGLLATVWMLEKFASNVELSLALVSMEYIVTSGLVLLTFAFILGYLGMSSWLTKTKAAILLVSASTLVLVMITNPLHGQFYTSVELLENGGLFFLRAEYGPIFPLVPIFYFLLMAACILLLNRAIIQSPPSRKKGPSVILLSILIIVVTFSLYLTSARDNPLVDMLSLGISLAAATLFIGERTSSFIGTEIITVQDAIESINDGLVITGMDREPIYMNRQAVELLADEGNRSLFDSINSPEPGLRKELPFHLDDGTRCYEVSFNDIQRNGRKAGMIAFLHDISTRKKTELELRQSKERNQTLSRIIEHDIKNELTAIIGYLELTQDDEYGYAEATYLEKIEERAWAVASHLEFARSYRMIGAEDPRFMCLRDVVREALSQLDLKGLEVRMELDDIQVFADPMLPKVFYNLAQNTIKHAPGASIISVSFRIDGARCLINYRDDGQGIPSELKSSMFDTESRTGDHHGMEIVREILNITDMSISEIGEDGADFLIIVPPGGWKRGNDVTNQ